MSAIIHGIAAGWSKTARNRKVHGVWASVSGCGRGEKSLRLTLVRGEGGAAERLDVTLLGQESLRALLEVCQQTLLSEADVVGPLTPDEYLPTREEMGLPEVPGSQD
jgi:hypothetical protein